MWGCLVFGSRADWGYIQGMSEHPSVERRAKAKTIEVLRQLAIEMEQYVEPAVCRAVTNVDFDNGLFAGKASERKLWASIIRAKMAELGDTYGHAAVGEVPDAYRQRN